MHTDKRGRWSEPNSDYLALCLACHHRLDPRAKRARDARDADPSSVLPGLESPDLARMPDPERIARETRHAAATPPPEPACDLIELAREAEQ